ncbi:TetR/AcrR family transcriptional regulator [Paraburkholderia sp. GAS448]
MVFPSGCVMMKQNSTAKNSVRTRQAAELKRAGQQRAQETRSAILDAALLEFASRRFDAASIRSIADRIGVQHPLITYHFRSKEILWQAVAEYVFERVRSERDANLSGSDSASAVERVKLAYRALFRFSVEYPEFHRFMLQEELGYSSRLQWIADTILKPLIAWLLPQIRAAQDEHALPKVEPIIFHYMLVSLTSTLSGFGPEISATSHLSPSDPALVDACWRTIEQLVFKTSQASTAPAGV